jgi:hypothetical protein
MNGSDAAALVERAGLVLLGQLPAPAAPLESGSSSAGLPRPAWAMHLAAGLGTPAVTVPLGVPDLPGRVDAAWLQLARGRGVVDADGTFLIALSRALPWMRVRLGREPRLSQVLVPDGARSGHAEFVTMAQDGSCMCAVTTEEYAVWVVVDDTALHRSPPPPSSVPPGADTTALNALQLHRLFRPDRLEPPLHDGWVLLGFDRRARRLARLHEAPSGFALERSPREGGEPLPLTDAEVAAIGTAWGIPVDPAVLTYRLEYETARAKAAQTTRRPMPESG